MLLLVLEFTTVVLAILLILTQVLLPAYRGQKLFPLFRAQGKLESKLAEVIQEQEEEKVLDEIVTKMSETKPKQSKAKRRK